MALDLYSLVFLIFYHKTYQQERLQIEQRTRIQLLCVQEETRNLEPLHSCFHTLHKLNMHLMLEFAFHIHRDHIYR